MQMIETIVFYCEDDSLESGGASKPHVISQRAQKTLTQP